MVSKADGIKQFEISGDLGTQEGGRPRLRKHGFYRALRRGDPKALNIYGTFQMIRNLSRQFAEKLLAPNPLLNLSESTGLIGIVYGKEGNKR